MTAITAAHPNRSDKIITVTKPPSLPGLYILITGVRYAAPAVYVPLTHLCPSKFARRLQLTHTHHTPHTHTHIQGSTAAEQRQKTSRAPRSFISPRCHNSSPLLKTHFFSSFTCVKMRLKAPKTPKSRSTQAGGFVTAQHI